MKTPLPSDSHPDRRDAQRLPSGLPIYVDGRQARLTDLSTEGVGFETREPPLPGERVQVGVRHLPDDAHPAPCEAEVVRVEAGAEGVFTVGARLRKPDGG